MGIAAEAGHGLGFRVVGPGRLLELRKSGGSEGLGFRIGFLLCHTCKKEPPKILYPVKCYAVVLLYYSVLYDRILCYTISH